VDKAIHVDPGSSHSPSDVTVSVACMASYLVELHGPLAVLNTFHLYLHLYNQAGTNETLLDLDSTEQAHQVSSKACYPLTPTLANHPDIDVQQAVDPHPANYYYSHHDYS